MKRRKPVTRGKRVANQREHQRYFNPKPRKHVLTKFQKYIRGESKAIYEARKVAHDKKKGEELRALSQAMWQYQHGRRPGRKNAGQFKARQAPVTKNGKLRIGWWRQHTDNRVKEVYLEVGIIPPPDETAFRKREFRGPRTFNYSYFWRCYGMAGQPIAEEILRVLLKYTGMGYHQMMTMVSIYMGTADGRNGSVGSPFDVPQRTLAFLQHFGSRASQQELMKEANGEIVFVVTARTMKPLHRRSNPLLRKKAKKIQESKATQEAKTKEALRRLFAGPDDE